MAGDHTRRTAAGLGHEVDTRLSFQPAIARKSDSYATGFAERPTNDDNIILYITHITKSLSIKKKVEGVIQSKYLPR